jgi:Flp pilus assembly protein TadB
MNEELLTILKEKIAEEKKTIENFIQLNAQLQRRRDERTKRILSPKIEYTKKKLKKQIEETKNILVKISLNKPANLEKVHAPFNKPSGDMPITSDINYSFLSEKGPLPAPLKKKDLSLLEKISLKRLRYKKPVSKVVKEKKPSQYVNLAVRNFYPLSKKVLEGGMFRDLKMNLVKSNMQFIPENYLSVIFFTTLLSLFASVFLFVFLLFFNLSMSLPIITSASESIQERLVKFMLIPFVIPLLTFLMVSFYPSMERKSVGNKINQELPFVTIHMSSISGAMKDPSKMFEIIILTGEYPAITKEFSKIINEINLYGYDLVSALRNSAFNCPSEKLAELYNGISTTISSGGDLSQFFEKRAETLLFDYKMERDKYNKATETYMDIYLSVVIAGPMILMLLLIIMRVSGLGITLSTSAISLITVSGVTIANIFFLIFLYIKQPAE